jgi:hypothetical protein
MISESTIYKMKEYLVDLNRLSLYYDFVSENAFAVQSGSSYQSYIRNIANTGVNGNLDGKIIDATGVSELTSLSSVTGVGEFLSNGQGDLSKKAIQISGSSQIDLSNSSYLMLIDSELSNDGVILGSLKKTTSTIGSTDYTFSSGFNYGQTSRGHDLFHSMNDDGEYSFVKNSDEHTKRRVVAINFNNSEASLYRFDYLNDKIRGESFACKPTQIGRSNSLYLGSSPEYFRGSEGDKLFSGKIEKLLVFSGRINSETLFEIGKSLLSEYQFTSGTVSSTGLLSGYTTQVVYKTGITGSYLQISGYETIRSGDPVWTQTGVFTGLMLVKEGDRVWANYGDHIESQGYLSNTHLHTYNPTGEAAFATLGLQALPSGSISGYTMSGSYVYPTIQIPLYETIYLTGTTTEISGVTSAPVYISGYTTGADTSGIYYSDSFSGFQKNLTYYLGQR